MDYVIVRTPTVLEHHGTKGQKWGERRYQYKDGSLTPLGKIRYKHNSEFKKSVDRKRALEKARAAKEAKKTEAERKEELLKSVDPAELYKNKDILSTAEINERLNRIDAEARLASKIPQQKTGLETFNEKMNTASNTINNATNLLNKVDNAYSTVAKSAIGKTLAKKLGLESPKKEFSYEDFLNNISKKSPEEVAAVSKRALNESLLRTNVENIKKATKSNTSAGTNSNQAQSSSANNNDTYERAKKQVDDYVNSGYKQDKVSSPNTYTYSYKNSDMTDTKVGTGNRNTASTLRLEQVDKYVASGKDVVGKGTSTYSGKKTYYYDDNPIWRDVSTSSETYRNNVAIGQNYVNTFLLEDKSK